MKEQKNLVPKKRFKEFQNNEEWKPRKLSELVINISDGDWIEANHIFDQGEYRIIQTGNIGIGNYIDKLDSAKYFHQKDFDELKANEIFPEDLLVSRLAEPAGRTIILPNIGYKMVTSVDVMIIRPDDSKFNSYFLMTQMNSESVLCQIAKDVSGTSHKRISRKNLEKINIMTPNIDEQRKIGLFFKDLDKLITLHQRKLEKTKALKCAYLSEMFPAEDESEPKRRFAGFTQPWEQRKLGEVSDIIGGGTPSTSNKEYWDGDIDWYSPFEIGDRTYVDSSQRKITQLGLQKSSAKILPIGTVLFTSRAGIGSTAILAKEGATNQGFQSIVPHKDELDSYFVYSRSHELKRYGEINGAGSTFVEVSGKQMAQMPMFIPTLEEQKKIGHFFERLDQLITLYQRKLEKLENIKKAYLNGMFI